MGGVSRLFAVAVAAMGFMAQATNSSSNATTTAAPATTAAAGPNYFLDGGGCGVPGLDVILSGSQVLIDVHVGAYVACLWCQCLDYDVSIVTQMLLSPQGLDMGVDAANLAGQEIECKKAMGTNGTCSKTFGELGAVAVVADELNSRNLGWALSVTMGQMCAPTAGCCAWGSSGSASTVTLGGTTVICPATGTSTTTTTTTTTATIMVSGASATAGPSIALSSVLAALISQF